MDEVKKEQEEIEQANLNAGYDEQRAWDEHKDECNGCALCEL